MIGRQDRSTADFSDKQHPPLSKTLKIDNYHVALLQSTKCINGPNATGKKVGDSFLGLA